MKRVADAAGPGFTLVELMVVVLVIGILASIAIMQFNAYRTQSFNAAAASDIRNMKNSLEAYFSEHRSYPAP